MNRRQMKALIYMLNAIRFEIRAIRHNEGGDHHRSESAAARAFGALDADDDIRETEGEPT